MGMTVYPAVDVRGGAVVRLYQGDYARETRYAGSPADVLRSYARQGAQWVHLVDLDAAREGGYTLVPLLRSLASERSLRVQTGGGIRGEADVEGVLEAGAARVVIGSRAVDDPAEVSRWLARFGPERLTLALDARCGPCGTWYPVSHGWSRSGGRTLRDLLAFYLDHGLRHALCTDVDRDGTLAGPNLAFYELLRTWAPGIAVQASGGVRDAADVAALAGIGCAGVVIGKALLEGRVTVAEAVAC
ncbi:HisA/HisF-related TIM barrel protein [Cognatiluteimonas telluris]|jgi:phosphoribosylformimino-5-aminoimidazole carboxamide ribotide isomerase|uniref:1-(5-phosphoribosyl)-5-[(5- phosphoribosylamino)methylideneamino]imidazole-4- carboxamide isomerase n=1 Tax=Cognatiluteimonas telluris TaxID=1104775 RepID=UPI0014079F66|nr:1-(5-phosphoribosyl)-5-[(5-phosphoribosylamino)methylideneamino] imidazole-4-carboxamide isomerase [Lysobacter telluris]